MNLYAGVELGRLAGEPADKLEPDNNNTAMSPATKVTMTLPGDSPGSEVSQTGSEVKRCAGCSRPIQDRYLLQALERFWHQACLKCHCCNNPLSELGATCFAKAGMVLCKQDYIRLFGSGGTCSSCQQSIPASELVMKVQGGVYHVHCFSCNACAVRLQPGDRYSILNGALLCEHDYPKVLKGQTQLQMRTPMHKV